MQNGYLVTFICFCYKIFNFTLNETDNNIKIIPLMILHGEHKDHIAAIKAINYLRAVNKRAGMGRLVVSLRVMAQSVC
jgi:hypothetical protein